MSEASDTLPFFRDQWTARFNGTCTITRVSGQTFNTTTGVYEGGSTATRYSGGCLVRPQAAASVEYGGQQVELRMYAVFIPYTVTGVVPDDIVTVTSTTDAELNGLEMVVRNIQVDEWNTRRRLECELNQGA
jgi:hypothetical protein